MSSDDPSELTDFEQRELLGEPHAWLEGSDLLVIEERVDGHEDWVSVAKFFVGSSQGLQLVALAIQRASSPPSPRALSTAVVRSVRLDDLHQKARGWLSIRQQAGIDINVDAAAFHRTRRPGSAGRPDDFYVHAAARYLELVGITRAPIRALGTEMNISPSSARDLIHEARTRGLLSRTARGVKGGELTEQALQILADEQKAT